LYSARVETGYESVDNLAANANPAATLTMSVPQTDVDNWRKVFPELQARAPKSWLAAHLTVLPGQYGTVIKKRPSAGIHFAVLPCLFQLFAGGIIRDHRGYSQKRYPLPLMYWHFKGLSDFLVRKPLKGPNISSNEAVNCVASSQNHAPFAF